MGGRGSYIDTVVFDFREGGQTFETNEKASIDISQISPNIRVIGKINEKASVAAPEISHTSNRIYVVMQNEMIKHIAFYNEKHEQVKVIDFGHYHDGIRPHIHYNLNHSPKLPGIPLTKGDKELIEKLVKAGYKLYEPRK